MYQLAENGVIRLKDHAFIPSSEDNRDWREYIEWLGFGNIPSPLRNEQNIPDAVSMMQARLALFNAGLLDKVDATISAMTEPSRIASKIRWEFAAMVRRDDQLVAELGTALGLDATQLDQLFITAAQL